MTRLIRRWRLWLHAEIAVPVWLTSCSYLLSNGTAETDEAISSFIASRPFLSGATMIHSFVNVALPSPALSCRVKLVMGSVSAVRLMPSNAGCQKPLSYSL